MTTLPIKPKRFRPFSTQFVIMSALTALIVLAVTPGIAIGKPKFETGNRPTIVLVHGAWAGPSGWDQVVERLQKHGFETVAVDLGLITLAADVSIVQSTLDGIAGDKVVVAHSYGGFVASNATFGRSDVRALVFTAAFVPEEGDTIASLGEGYAPPAALEHLTWTGEPWNSLSYIDPDYFREVFAADLSPKQAKAMSDQQKASSPASLVTPSGPVGWHDIPSWYAISGKDKIIDPALQQFMAERAGSTVIRFPSASHVGGFTVHSARFVKLIEEAVQVTAN